MPTARSRSICSMPAAMAALAEDEAEAELRRLLPPREPEVVAALGGSRQPGDCSRDSRDAARRSVEEVAVNRLSNVRRLLSSDN